MDIISAPDTKLVTVLSVGFASGKEASIVIDHAAGDIWTTDKVTGDITIHIAPKPEKHISVKEHGKERIVTISAQPQKTIIWFESQFAWLEFNDARAVEHPAYPRT